MAAGFKICPENYQQQDHQQESTGSSSLQREKSACECKRYACLPGPLLSACFVARPMVASRVCASFRQLSCASLVPDLKRKVWGDISIAPDIAPGATIIPEMPDTFIQVEMARAMSMGLLRQKR
eukprot:1310259-Amphidinium_carterae.2